MAEKAFRDVVKRALRAQQDADKEYQRMRKVIDSRLKMINRLLKEEDKRQKADPRNWGFVGDLGHIEELLSEIGEFLGG